VRPGPLFLGMAAACLLPATAAFGLASVGGPDAPAAQAAPATRATAGAGTIEPPRPQETPAPPPEAGPVRIEVAVDRKTVTVGDPIAVTVRLIHPPGLRITAFDPELALGDLTLLGRLPPESTALPDGRVRETRVLRVARYQMGESRIPAFEAIFIDASGKEGRVATAPVSFTVGSVLAEGDNQPADIKNPAVMPERPIWPWVLLAAAVAAVAAAWAWRRRRARRAAPGTATEARPARPAHEVAYAELERLLSAGLLEKGRIKEFYIELAEIVKRYFEARFGVDTFERTSAEILEALRLARLPTKGLALTTDVFASCDLVKFAKYAPSSEETRVAVERAYRLVDETRARDEAPAQETPALAQDRAAGSAP
jgi:hypothetical protein